MTKPNLPIQTGLDIFSDIAATDKEIREYVESANQKPSTNPPSEYGDKKVLGHTIHDGPATSVTVRFDDSGIPYECHVMIVQNRPVCNPKVRVGPINTDLSVLMENHWLEAQVDYRQIKSIGIRPIRIYLTNGDDRYKMKSVSWAELQKNGRKNGQYDLGAFIPTNHDMLRAHSRARPMTTVVQEKVVDRDPFEVLAERYPTPDKNKVSLDTLVGNRTIRERLSDHF